MKILEAASQREKLLSLLLEYESLFDGTQGDWNLLLEYESLFDGTQGDWNQPPISIKLKEGANAGHTPYHKYTKPLQSKRSIG